LLWGQYFGVYGGFSCCFLRAWTKFDFTGVSAIAFLEDEFNLTRKGGGDHFWRSDVYSDSTCDFLLGKGYWRRDDFWGTSVSLGGICND